ncbi:hypothetical protein AwPolaro_10720 [Polaromonas sp.]|nr:hypothetical protein AwPolaro_10720 [Polaromonas sp.]
MAQDTKSAAMAIIGTIRRRALSAALNGGLRPAQTSFSTWGNIMTLLLLEALGALLLLIFIVWWTMFSGRKNGEIKTDTLPEDKKEP